MAEIEHLSYSSISLHQMCGKAWEFRYVEKLQVPTSPSLVFGTAYHGALEEAIRLKAVGAQPDMAELWSQQWTAATQKEIAWNGELPEAMSNQGLRMLACEETQKLLDGLTPMLNPEAEPVIEHRVELRVPGVPVPLIGFIDLICGDGVPADMKTAAKAWTHKKAQEEMQPAVYLAALSQAGYTQNPGMKFRHFVFTKTKTPQVQVLETTRTAADLFRVMRLVGDTWRAIQAGSFQARTDIWKHSEKYCEYWHHCPYGGKG